MRTSHTLHTHYTSHVHPPHICTAYPYTTYHYTTHTPALHNHTPHITHLHYTPARTTHYHTPPHTPYTHHTQLCIIKITRTHIYAYNTYTHSIGMTLDKVELSLNGAFDAGMAYVALSRVRSLEGLNLKTFTPSSVKVNSVVKNWYQELDDNWSFCINE